MMIFGVLLRCNIKTSEEYDTDFYKEMEFLHRF